MKLPFTFAMVCMFSYAITLTSQEVAPTLGDALKLSATVDKRIYKAGESIVIPIHLTDPATRTLNFSQTLYCDNTYMRFDGSIKMGSTDGTVTTKVSNLPVSGKCRLETLEIAAPPQVNNEQVVLPTTIKLPTPIDFEIIGPPRVAEVIPGIASAEASLPERQFFRSRAAQLREQRDGLMLYLDHHAGEVPELDSQLLDALTQARHRLATTKQDFIVRYKPRDEVLVFFEDLDRRYEALTIDISAHRAKLIAKTAYGGHLVEAQQLKERPRGTTGNQGDGHSKLSGTLPPDAYEAVDLIEWNIDVYEKIAESGEETFSISLVTLPADASVEAKRIGEEYYLLGMRTTIPKVTFPFAIWTFRFRKENCRDHVQRYDPIHDTSPSVSVELVCGR